MKLRLLFALTLTIALNTFSALPPEYEKLKADAEKFYSDGSFAKAHELYQRAMIMSNITSNEARWVWFRNFDTQWRSEASTERADTTKLDEARAELEKMVRDVTREDEKNRLWVEVEESLGDWWWTRRNNNNWGQGWPYYQAALDWWAEQDLLHLVEHSM